MSFTAGVTLTLSSLMPMWLLTTTELEGKMCSCGSGLWRANFTWGDDIVEKNLVEALECASSNPRVTPRCDAKWDVAEDSHRRGVQAGVLSIIAVLSLGLAVVFAWNHVPVQGSPINAWRACVCSFVAFGFQGIAHVWFSSGPLFDDLSYYFGCQFQFVEPLHSNSLVCHALGPGWALSAVGTIFAFVAGVLFYFAYNPTEYVHPNSGRYSLFTEMFDRRLDKLVVMASSEDQPPVDESTAFRRFVRAYGVPLLCLGNIALFLYSNISTGATVEPQIYIKFPKWIGLILKDAGLPLNKDFAIEFRDDVFNFTLISSLRHFWKGQAYGLAFLIGVFSGVWPYAKVFAMLMMWFIPASERLRSRGLHWIDMLGKWSLIDSFFLCLMCVGFGFDTSVSILGIAIAVKIEVRPGWGVYSFVLATIWSLLLSHYLTYLHQASVERRTWTKVFLQSTEDPPHESLDSRPYAPLARRRRFKCRAMGRACIWLVLVFTVCVTASGQLVESFKFNFGGLAELILPPEKQVNPYSLVSIGEAIPESAQHGGYLSGHGWNWFLTAQFFLLAMFVPLLRIVILMLLWSVPMTLGSMKRLHHLGNVVAAWSAMDVFLVSTCIARLSELTLTNDHPMQQV